MTGPLISAVLCARDAGERLRSTLESLCVQTLPREEFEVVVVDDGSPAGFDAIAGSFESRLPLRWSRQREAGIASARNHGLFLARGGVVLFLDEDVADPDLLRWHVDAHRRFPEPRFAVRGRTELDPAIAGDPLMRFAHGGGASPLSDPETKPGEPLDWTHFRTGRSSCKRRFLLERGTFASAFRSAGEDAELAHRLSRHGFQVVHEPRAVTRLARRLGVDEFCAWMYRRGWAHGLLGRLHPEAVEGSADARAAAEAWGEIGPAYGAMVRSARELDRLVRLRGEAGIPVESGDWPLLHRSYWAAFQASWVKGVVDFAAGSRGP